MSPAVSIFIIVLTVLNTVAAVWLLVWMRKRRGEAERTSDTTGHVWDGDLREYNNPLPRWWLWLFVLSVVFAVVYVALYPGLGNMRGVLGWSQVKEWQQMQAQQERQAQTILARFAERDPLELAAEPAAVALGRNLFANNCAACHGSDGRGSTGFPNLTDADWLWGGDAETVRTSIAQGRMGIMAPWQEVLGDQGVGDVSAYVMTLSGRKASAGDAAVGAAQYATYCVACHGPDGRGNMAVGAPDLTDGIWLHGGSEARIRETIALGRQNNMPAQESRLGDTRIRLLAAYVLSLGEGPRVAAARQP
ncbi:MAG: cytochrome-c oxidase, cbb3-type subunit III [Gammaproteobacteria bacterium]